MTLGQVRGLAATMPVIARVGAQVAAERWRPQAPDDPARVPSRVELITPAWMTAALCADVPGARVLAVHPAEGSSGTTYRRRLVLECNDAAREGGVPATVFTKSAPGALQRMTQSITGPVEARFYLELRSHLPIEAPHCFHGAVDERRRDPRGAWNAVLRSIALHDGRPATLLHNDVHLGNWYRTADGRMGLCDWQAVVLGHWSRDLAYAGVLAGLEPRQRGPKAPSAGEAELARLRGQLERAEADLQTARRVIEVQGNVSALLEDLLAPKSATGLDAPRPAR